MRKTGSNSNKQLSMKRIRYEKQGELMVSRMPYSDGRNIVRVILNPAINMYYITDVLTGHVFASGGEGLTNFEVVQRHAKRALEEFLDSNFIIEKKKTRSDE